MSMIHNLGHDSSKTRWHVSVLMDCRAVEKALVQGHTKLLMLESPTNPRMQICDIATLTRMAHQVCLPSLQAEKRKEKKKKSLRH